MSHVLELNGRRYNAMTGVLLEEAESKSVDGMVKPALHHAAAHHTRVTAAAHRELHGQPAVHQEAARPKAFDDVQRSTPLRTRPHQVQHSKTLMRAGLHKPKPTLKRQTKPTVHTGALAKTVHFDIMPKYSVSSVDEDRLRRAKHTSQSKFIHHFGAERPDNARQPMRADAAPEPAKAVIARETPATAPTRQPSTDIFERALAAANTHTQPYAPIKHKTKKSHRLRRVAGIAASSLAIVLLVGFIAYQNATELQLKLASSRSGVSATLPTWQPDGFRLGTFAYQPGSVTISYRNTDASRNYSIAEAPSSWDSASLLSNYVYPGNETYDTIDAGGTTLYMYGKNNATWVSDGIWYKLTSDGNLSTSQIVNIATSMQS